MLLAFFLINISNLFIKKDMFNEAAIVSYFCCILDCLQLYLTTARNTKDIKTIESFSVKDASISNISTRGMFK